jgi:hypothetical protein
MVRVKGRKATCRIFSICLTCSCNLINTSPSREGPIRCEHFGRLSKIWEGCSPAVPHVRSVRKRQSMPLCCGLGDPLSLREGGDPQLSLLRTERSGVLQLSDGAATIGMMMNARNTCLLVGRRVCVHMLTQPRGRPPTGNFIRKPSTVSSKEATSPQSADGRIYPRFICNFHALPEVSSYKPPIHKLQE